MDALDREPAEINLDGKAESVPVGAFGLRCVLGNALGSRRAMQGLANFARQLARTDFAALSRRFDRWVSHSTVHGMSLAMDHAAGASPNRMRRIETERVGALLDDSFNLPYPFIGRELGVDELDDAFRAPVQADTPTLFCAGTLDGRTPVSNAEAVLGGFPNGRLIVVEGMVHEEPHLLLDVFEEFLNGEDVDTERLVMTFTFDAIA